MGCLLMMGAAAEARADEPAEPVWLSSFAPDVGQCAAAGLPEVEGLGDVPAPTPMSCNPPVCSCGRSCFFTCDCHCQADYLECEAGCGPPSCIFECENIARDCTNNCAISC